MKCSFIFLIGMPTNYQDSEATKDVRRASDCERDSAVETQARNCQ